MKLLIVSDSPHSPLSIAARARAEILVSDVIYASSFSSPSRLIRYITSNGYQGVIFTWRGALKEGLQISSFRKEYSELLLKSSVHCLIPDFLGLDPRFLKEEKMLLNSVHGYWVTCKILYSEYSETFPDNQPMGILHDMPDISLISSFASTPKMPQIIWVGNSRWGNRFGFRDHKGFDRFVKPLQYRFALKFPNVEFRIIDSAKERLPNFAVLEQINLSKVLLQTSESEGTGLPILEALGLGVVPVTTDVGVAREVLSGTLTKFICERNIISMEAAIREALDFEDSELLKSTYDSFVEFAKTEKIIWRKTEIHVPTNSSIGIKVIKLKLIWLYRYLTGLKRIWK